MSHTCLSDPVKLGPGMWTAIHQLASNIQSYADLHYAIQTIELYINRFKCMECRKHAQAYIQKNPLRQVLECNHKNHKGGIERCLFHYTWVFHDIVNQRLKKARMDEETAWSCHSGGGFDVCDDKCGEHDAYEAKATPQEAKPVFFVKSVPHTQK